MLPDVLQITVCACDLNTEMCVYRIHLIKKLEDVGLTGNTALLLIIHIESIALSWRDRCTYVCSIVFSCHVIV